MNEPIFTNDSGWHDDFSLAGAVSYVALQAEDAEGNIETIARMLAAMLEKLPVEEQLRVLNAGGRRVWKVEP